MGADVDTVTRDAPLQKGNTMSDFFWNHTPIHAPFAGTAQPYIADGGNRTALVDAIPD